MAVGMPRRSGAPLTRAASAPLIHASWRIAVAAALTLLAAHLAAAAIWRDGTLLDAGREGGVFTWASVVVTASAALPLVALAAPARAERLPALVVTPILLFLALDDALMLHERIGDIDVLLGLGERGGRVVWPVVYAPLLSIAAWGLLRVAEQAPPRTRRCLRGGLTALGLALAFEVGSYGLVLAGIEPATWPWRIEVGLEEALEMAGWILLAGGLAAAALAAGSPSRGPRAPRRRSRGNRRPRGSSAS